MVSKIPPVGIPSTIDIASLQENQLKQLAAELERLRDAANCMSLAIEDLRFELSCKYPFLSMEELEPIVGEMTSIAIRSRVT